MSSFILSLILHLYQYKINVAKLKKTCQIDILFITMLHLHKYKGQTMRLPSDDTLYKTLIFLLVLMVVLGIVFDTDYN